MKQASRIASDGGFTLIELLIVIGIVGVLATVVFVILDPVSRFQDSRNARRWSDVEAMMSAIKLYQSDKKAHIAEISDNMIDGLFYQIGNAGTDPNCALSCGAQTLEGQCIDLAELVDTGYLPAVPFDPSGSGAALIYSHYYISKTAAGAITIGACDEEKGHYDAVQEISLTR